MKKLLFTLALSILVVSLAVGTAFAGKPGSQVGTERHRSQGSQGPAANRPVSEAQPPAADPDAIAVAIDVAPKVLVLSAGGSWVTVHADIPYTQVAGGSVALNGIPAVLTFADDCGDLVGKFAQGDVEAIVAPPEALLTLTGTTTGGEAFTGSAVIRVIAGNAR